jgi:hypothetical protein
MLDADGLKVMDAIKSKTVQHEFGNALDKAGTDGDPAKSREADGGIAEITKSGEPTGTYTAYSQVKDTATVGGTKPDSADEINAKTGGNPVADFHTHQLAGRAVTDEFKKYQTPNPSEPNDTAAVGATGLPQLVVSRTQVTMAWENDAHQIKTAIIMTFRNPEALAKGDVSIVMPKELQK